MDSPLVASFDKAIDQLPAAKREELVEKLLESLPEEAKLRVLNRQLKKAGMTSAIASSKINNFRNFDLEVAGILELIVQMQQSRRFQTSLPGEG